MTYNSVGSVHEDLTDVLIHRTLTVLYVGHVLDHHLGRDLGVRSDDNLDEGRVGYELRG